MSARTSIVAIGLATATFTAHAGWFAVLPESASVTLVFGALAAIACALRRTASAVAATDG